jgi:hypothetical protein
MPKNCVSDYPLSNSTAECPARREAWWGYLCAIGTMVCCCGMCVPPSGTQSPSRRPKGSRWLGMAVSLSQRMWMSPIKYWRSGSICKVRAKRSKGICCGDSGHQEQYDEGRRRLPDVGSAYCCCLRSSNQGSSASRREFAELSGTTKWWVLFLCLWTGRC